MIVTVFVSKRCVHIWLPEAHVEAPTAGSVILAGIALKLGTYGFLRFSIPMFPEATLCSTASRAAYERVPAMPGHHNIHKRD